MAQVSDEKSDENDDTICPITLEPFRDPVTATDGHVYEREAITRWILEHGTSPFTREPLQISDLRSNDHLKDLATRRQNLTVSYDARNHSIALPPLRRIMRRTGRIAPGADINAVRRHPRVKKWCRIGALVIWLTGVLAVTIYSIVSGFKERNS